MASNLIGNKNKGFPREKLMKKDFKNIDFIKRITTTNQINGKKLTTEQIAD